MKKLQALAGAAFAAVVCISACSSGSDASLTDYVDPRIGSGGHGHVFVGANVPFGLVQAGPTSVTEGWDWCSGYHESDSTVIGFSQTHLSGTGCGDLLDVNIMPVVGRDLTYARGRVDSIGSGIWSYADRSREIARPGYYSVPLTRYDVLAEMTATSRVGFYRFTFPESGEAGIVIDLQNGGGWRNPEDITMRAVSDTRIVGHRHSAGWANNQKLYFAIDFSRPFTELVEVGENYGRVDFDTKAGETILVKVAVSPVSEEGAQANLVAELQGWDFDATAAMAQKLWNDELNKIKIKGGTEDERKIFYTAMYHTMIAPSEFCDVNNDTRAADGTVKRDMPYKSYTTYSLWDTYRAAMPLLSITHPDRYADMVNCMTDICEAQGRLPIWHLWGCETYCMVGSPGLPVVADAIVKDIPGVDKERAYKALLTTAMDSIRGNDLRMAHGYIPFDLFARESVAYDMELALADWAVAQAALCMGDTANHSYFMQRSLSYRNYFDPSTGFMRGKDSKGNMREPFNEFDTSHRVNDYCEGNAWQYTWLVPHDVEGLRDLFGSDERMIAKLDSLFVTESKLEGEDVSPDVSGLIGQYAHGNEPGHHTVYLYTMLGYPERTADLVRYILANMYSTERDGLAGNEDVGQMSAWYMLSAMGLYEVEPGSGRYYFGSPLFDEVDITVPGGTFRIIAENNSATNKYIKSASLNGQQLYNRFINYEDIMQGGELRFMMGDR